MHQFFPLLLFLQIYIQRTMGSKFSSLPNKRVWSIWRSSNFKVHHEIGVYSIIMVILLIQTPCWCGKNSKKVIDRHINDLNLNMKYSTFHNYCKIQRFIWTPRTFRSTALYFISLISLCIAEQIPKQQNRMAMVKSRYTIRL